ncbi:DUF6175 family protein [Bacteroides sp.]
MKKLAIACMMLCACFVAKAQDTRGTGSGVKQPEIVVVPFTLEGEDVRQVIEQNPMMALAISKVKEQFNDRGFITKDFITLLKASKNTSLMMDEAAIDYKARIVRESKADIQVLVKIVGNQEANGAVEVALMLEAVEVQTGNSLANKSYMSGKFITNDFIKLANRALNMIGDDFFSNLQSAFNQMVEDGRELAIQIGFSSDCEMDATSEVGSNGNDFQMEVEDWLLNNAFKGVYSVNGSEKLLDISMQVPLYDQTSGAPFNLSRMRTVLKRFLDPLLASNGCIAKVNVTGQRLHVIIDLKGK